MSLTKIGGCFHGTNVSTDEHTELPASSHICSQSRTTRSIILPGDKNNHKIKIAETGQLAVCIRPLDCKYIIYHFRNTEHIDYL